MSAAPVRTSSALATLLIIVGCSQGARPRETPAPDAVGIPAAPASQVEAAQAGESRSMLELLASERREARQEAVHHFVLEPHRDAALGLAAALADPQLAQMAAVALARLLPASSAAEACAGALGSESAGARILAASLLDVDGVREHYVTQLAWLAAEDPDEQVRRTAVTVLGSAGHAERVRAALASAASDRSAEVRLAALRALAGVDAERRVPILFHALHDDEDRVRELAGRQLLAELLLTGALAEEGSSLVEQLRELASSDAAAAHEAGRLLEQARSWR